jgi:hypothetical protein
LCRLGFHKWRNYGNQIEIFWQEPTPLKAGAKYGIDTSVGLRKSALGVHSEIVCEGRECKRCGIKLRRKLVTNSDGALSCVGWELDAEETNEM